jgi:EmrB/QacA subfamily drug resistance transporter
MTNVETPKTAEAREVNFQDASTTPTPDPRRWRALMVLAFVQFIIFLDATIVNVALPAIQRDLGFTAGGLTWVVNGYLLAAGGLLLAGGRLADLLGRRKLFLSGAGLFAVASLTAAVAWSPAVLIVGRFAQGIAEAIAAPAAMALVALLFTNPAERAKAFGIWGGLAGLGSATGVVLSGVLTDLVSWRLVFLVNIPLALIPLIFGPKLLTESKMSGKRPDLISAVLVTGGLIAVIQGLLTASTDGWGAGSTLTPLLIGVAALVLFVIVQAKSSNPLVPLRFFANRTRATGNIALIFQASASAAMFFLAVLYMQQVLGFNPLQSGLAWLPFCVFVLAGMMLTMNLLPKVGPRNAIIVGMLISAAGTLMLSYITVDGTYWTSILPASVLIGLGGGITGPALQAAALQDVSMEDAGLGSGVLTTVQQMGQALGLTVIVAIALSIESGALAGGHSAAAAATSGYQVAFLVASIVLAVGALSAAVLVKRNKPNPAVAVA